LVCAPSNCAIDEILNRLLSTNLIFNSEINLRSLISRVAAPEYDCTPLIKQYTVREKAGVKRENENTNLCKLGEVLIK